MSAPSFQLSRAFLIPAYNPGDLLDVVLAELRAELARAGLGDIPIVVIDDGCTDDSFRDRESLSAPGVTVLVHETNRGKGAALMTGLHWARDHGISTVVTLDADNQHPAVEARRLMVHEASPEALVLSVRDLSGAGAPLANQRSNDFSNRVLSLFGGAELLDTQCGLRRYPVLATLALGASHRGYAFESDVVLRAARRGLPIVHVPAEVRYPKGALRVSHFDSVRDPAKIVLQVVLTTLAVPHHSPLRRWGRRFLLVCLMAFLVFLF